MPQFNRKSKSLKMSKVQRLSVNEPVAEEEEKAETSAPGLDSLHKTLTDSRERNPSSILSVQRSLGNQTVLRMLGKGPGTPQGRSKGVIQRVSIEDRNWASVTKMARSGEGSVGVYFVTADEANS